MSLAASTRERLRNSASKLSSAIVRIPKHRGPWDARHPSRARLGDISSSIRSSLRAIWRRQHPPQPRRRKWGYSRTAREAGFSVHRDACVGLTCRRGCGQQHSWSIGNGPMGESRMRATQIMDGRKEGRAPVGDWWSPKLCGKQVCIIDRVRLHCRRHRYRARQAGRVIASRRPRSEPRPGVDSRRSARRRDLPS